MCVEGTAGVLQGCDFDVKFLLTPIRKAGVSGGIPSCCFLADRPSILPCSASMLRRTAKGYQTMIHELLEKAASRAA